MLPKGSHKAPQLVECLQPVVVAVGDQDAVGYAAALAYAGHVADAQLVEDGVGLLPLPRGGANIDGRPQHIGRVGIVAARALLAVDVKGDGRVLPGGRHVMPFPGLPVAHRVGHAIFLVAIPDHEP